MIEQLYLNNPSTKYTESYLNFVEECGTDIIKTGFEFYIPLSTKESLETDIDKLINMSSNEKLPADWVPTSVYWLINNTNKVIGVIVIRHMLTKKLMFRGGHIAYYIRPSERTKGYASKMLALSLENCRRLNISNVLITCSKSNINSAKTIKANGGILECEDCDDGEEFQRYYIKINPNI